ncbi:MAG: pyridoxal-phosphate dependent enzyme [Anaerolineae bacterium]|nr:pyridoxal-phosphate dependent enzyme [Anaerolineae bacterium]
MDAAELLALINTHPRVPLAHYPTPLVALPRLSTALGRPLYLKRDDEIGPALGGNKTRKLEFLLADALRRGHRKVATFGGLQSNHARLTAAAARRLGLEAHLFYFERRPATLSGNLLLNRLLGATMHFVPLGGGGDGGMTVETAIRLAGLVARLRLGRHYFIPVGGHHWLGCLGYVAAAAELDQQARSLGIGDARVVVAAGSGGTLAGLLAGFTLIGSGLRPLGVDVGKLWRSFPASIARLATELCRRLGQPHAFTPEQVPLVEGVYVGPRYGVPSAAGNAAIERLARAEGVLLDPIYTGKAFAGLLDLAAQGVLAADEPAIFLHTGGLPALFADCQPVG